MRTDTANDHWAEERRAKSPCFHNVRHHGDTEKADEDASGDIARLVLINNNRAAVGLEVHCLCTLKEMPNLRYFGGCIDGLVLDGDELVVFRSNKEA